MPRDRQLQVHQGLDVVTAEVEYTFTEVEEPEGGDDAGDTGRGRDTEYKAHVPSLGLALVVDPVVGDQRFAPSLSSASMTIMTAVTG